MKAPALPKFNLPKLDFKVLLEDFKTLDPKDLVWMESAVD